MFTVTAADLATALVPNRHLRFCIIKLMVHFAAKAAGVRSWGCCGRSPTTATSMASSNRRAQPRASASTARLRASGIVAIPTARSASEELARAPRRRAPVSQDQRPRRHRIRGRMIDEPVAVGPVDALRNTR